MDESEGHQGKEMAQHAQFSIDTGVQVYFYDPKSPWQLDPMPVRFRRIPHDVRSNAWARTGRSESDR